MSNLRTAGAALAAVLLASSPALATVVPDKPSNLVTLVSLGDASDCQGAPQFSRRLFSDGSFADFAIPPKQVLVITALEIEGQGASANRKVLIRILQTPTFYPRLTLHDQADGLGFFGTYQTISPVVVKSGHALCLDVGGGLTIGTIHGFLAKDR